MRRDLLEEAQREMRERLENKDDIDREKEEINEICKRTDLICPYCEKNPTKASKKSGVILPCKKCYNKRIQLYKYGLNLHSYKKMLREQGNRCAICNKELTDGKGRSSAHVDHCHAFNHVRGILCGGCNQGIGSFLENEEVLLNAVKYIRINNLSRKWWFQKD